MNIEKSISLAEFSAFGIGGPADFFVRIFCEEDLNFALDFAESKNLPQIFLGGGSNTLFSDQGFRGIVFCFQNKKITFEKGQIIAESGSSNAEIFQFSKKLGRDFSHFLTVPGTIGGAVFGNAGTPVAEIGAFVVGADLFDIKERKMFPAEKDFFSFGYRKTVLQESRNLVVWRVFLDLPEQNLNFIESRAKELVAERQAKQPWGKTGGSFFKNPSPGSSAGFLLDQSGFRGKKHGGAFFSEKHANFLMNDGSSTQKELIELAREAKKAVFEKFGFILENEIYIFDENGKPIAI